MLKTPFSPWPSFTEEEADAARDVVLSNRVNYWTGEQCRRFEDEFATWCGTKHAIAVANGTVALDLAWIALGVGAGDEVILTPRTFLASASSVVNAGAVPVFADVDPDSQNITPASVEKVITPKTKAILLVHLAGWPCDMDGFRELADRHGLFLVEDCAQAHGATYRGRSVGSFGHISAWSFCQDKIMTTAGEGGMITTDNTEWWKTMWAFKDHGKSHDAVYGRQHPPGFRWLHESFGTNWRLTEVQGAIGRIQLARMTEWTAARTDNATRILGAAAALPALRAPLPPADQAHAWYKAYVFLRPELVKPDWSRDRIVNAINAAGVPCYTGSCSEIYLEKAFDDTGWRPDERLPIAKELGETSIMFLVHPTLTDAEIEQTCRVLVEVVTEATRQA